MASVLPDETPPRRARMLAAPSLRPYLRGSAHVARALGTGSAVLGRRLWAARRTPRLLAIIRASQIATVPGTFGVACGAVALWYVVGRYVVWIAAGLGTTWTVLALMHSRPEPAANAAPDAPAEAPVEEVEQDPRGAFLAHVRRGIGAGSGVHLRTLAKQPPTDGFTIPEIRALCDRYEVPVSRRVKVGGRVSVGVRLADLPALSPTVTQEQDAAGSSAA